MRYAAIAVALLFLSAPVVRADKFYQVTGSLTLTGNDVCGGPCVETIDFSFDLDEAYSPYPPLGGGTPGYMLSVVGTPAITESGPLSLTFDPNIQAAGNGTGTPNSNWLAFYSTTDLVPPDEIDIWANLNDQLMPFVPTIGGSALYSCGTQVCATDFCPSDECGSPSWIGPWAGLYVYGTAESSVVALTPEPATWLLLIIGLAALPLSRRLRPRHLR